VQCFEAGVFFFLVAESFLLVFDDLDEFFETAFEVSDDFHERGACLGDDDVFIHVVVASFENHLDELQGDRCLRG